jgi:hypothetical protein
MAQLRSGGDVDGVPEWILYPVRDDYVTDEDRAPSRCGETREEWYLDYLALCRYGEAVRQWCKANGISHRDEPKPGEFWGLTRNYPGQNRRVVEGL